jgi:hypothetical protein
MAAAAVFLNTVVSLSDYGWCARPSFDRLRTRLAFAARDCHSSGELVEPR